MKKNLLLLAGALAVGSAAWAIEGSQIVENTCINQISPNGNWAAGSDGDGTIVLVDLTTGKSTVIADEDNYYDPGVGNYLSDTGVLVGSIDSSGLTAYYYEDDEWFPLPLQTGDKYALSMGITPDGNRICGQVSRADFSADAEGIMDQPVIWNRNSLGWYDDYIVLPFPATDFSGRAPQKSTAICISDDGKTIIGQLFDYSGGVVQPIVYREDENGEWSYEILWDANPDGIEIGEAPEFPEYVNYEDYMTEEELADYNAAVALYWQTWEGKYPQPEDFMSDEEYEAYAAAVETYNAQLEAYYQWAEGLEELMEAVPDFAYNDIKLSGNGQYYLTTTMAGSYNFETWEFEYNAEIYVFDLVSGDYKTMQVGDMMASYINNDGVILAAGPIYNYDREAYIKLADSDEFTPLYDYIQTINSETAEWMTANMTHTYYEESYDFDLEDWVYTEVTNMIVGTPCANADMSVIGTWAYNCWSYEDVNYYSYILDTKLLSGIADAIATVSNVVKVEVFDIQGRRVYEGAAMPTSLNNGLYIVRTTDANGNVASSKVAIN